MERKSRVAAMLSMLLVSAPTTAKKITTTNLRDDTMKTNAVEVEGATQSDDLAVNQTAKAQNPAEIMVLDTDSLKFDFNSATIKDENVGTLKKLKDYIEKKNYKVAIYGHTAVSYTHLFYKKFEKNCYIWYNNRTLIFSIKALFIKLFGVV